MSQSSLVRLQLQEERPLLLLLPLLILLYMLLWLLLLSRLVGSRRLLIDHLQGQGSVNELDNTCHYYCLGVLAGAAGGLLAAGAAGVLAFSCCNCSCSFMARGIHLPADQAPADTARGLGTWMNTTPLGSAVAGGVLAVSNAASTASAS